MEIALQLLSLHVLVSEMWKNLSILFHNEIDIRLFDVLFVGLHIRTTCTKYRFFCIFYMHRIIRKIKLLYFSMQILHAWRPIIFRTDIDRFLN